MHDCAAIHTNATLCALSNLNYRFDVSKTYTANNKFRFVKRSKLLHCLESAIVLLQFNYHTFLLLFEF